MLTRLVKREEFLLVGMTSPLCEVCCPYESVIKKMMDTHFKNETSLLHPKDIKVARVNVAAEPWFTELHPTVKGLPNWVMYVRGKPLYFQDTTFVNRMMNSVRRMVEPYQPIYSLSGFEDFMAFTKLDITGRFVVRDKIVGLFADADDYDEIVADFRQVALMAYWKEDTMFALCTKSSVVKEIYAKYGSKYFTNPYDKNLIFFLNMKNRFEHADSLTVYDLNKPGKIEQWLSSSILKPLQELTSLNELTLSAKAPMLVSFVDPRNEAVTQRFLDRMADLGRKYLDRIVFTWVDYRDNLQLMKKLGLEGCR